MSDSETGWMPEIVDRPPTVLYWEVDKIIIPLILLVIGTLVNQFWLCIVAIIVYFIFLNKYSEHIPRGFGINILYGSGMLPLDSFPTIFCSTFEE